jgi:hypothetical protein
MKVDFKDARVDIKRLTVGTVVFLADNSAPDDIEKAYPCHIKRFSLSTFNGIALVVDCNGVQYTKYVADLFFGEEQ